MSSITAIPALTDNYIWAIAPATAIAGSRVAIVDPGVAEPVQAWLTQHQFALGAILVTHHHGDHTAGIAELCAHQKAASGDEIPVFGPQAESDQIGQLTVPLAPGDDCRLDWLELDFSVIATPGHTLGHIAYHAPGVLLAGDTLFRGGCGRVFEGSPEQMHDSLARLRQLPGATRFYAGHEYTQKNLEFAHMVEPDNRDVTRVADAVHALRADNQPSLPGTLAEERLINPFLRWDEPRVARAASDRAGHELTEPAAIFAELRAWKDAA
ncbi:MAG TPA: hydroxyacylglutathione hydrolase [Salinisphaeraceae bacterium]|nr:hydroxyacylglutathione hydrolase [Salinisphaeraceae bacterium]